MANRPSSTSVVCCSGSAFICPPRPKKGAFRGAFFSICQFAGVGHLAAGATVSSGNFLLRSTHTLTSGIHAPAPTPPTPYSWRTLPGLRQFANPLRSCGGMRSCVLQVDISCPIPFHIRHQRGSCLKTAAQCISNHRRHQSNNRSSLSFQHFLSF